MNARSQFFLDVCINLVIKIFRISVMAFLRSIFRHFSEDITPSLVLLVFHMHEAAKMVPFIFFVVTGIMC